MLLLQGTVIKNVNVDGYLIKCLVLLRKKWEIIVLKL